jgi:hypothetical protein
MQKCLPGAVLGVFLSAMASVAVAAEGTSWVGREIDDNQTTWSCTQQGIGDSWTVRRNGQSYSFETAADNSDVIDLQLKGDKTFRLRISKDTLYINEAGTNFRWVPLAKGKWHK